MALFYNPTSVLAAGLLQRRGENPTVSKARQTELLSQALAEARDKDPLYNLALDKTTYEPPEASGVTGEIAKHLMRWTGENEMKGVEGQYQERQRQQNEMYSQILSGGEGGQSIVDSLPSQQRDVISRVLQSGDSDMIQAVVGQVVKQSFEPGAKPKFSAPINVGGKLVTYEESEPNNQRVLGDAPNDADLEEIEMIGPGGPGIYNRNKRTGQIVGDKIGDIYNKPANTVINNIADKAESAGRKAQAEASSAIWKDTFTAAQGARDVKAAIQQFREVSNGTPQGPVSSYSLPIRSALNELGLKDDAIPNQEVMNSATAAMVIADAKKLGTNPTDRDSILLERKSPTLAKTSQGNAIIMNYGERAADRKMNEAVWMSEWLASPESGGILGPGWNAYLKRKEEENPLLTPEERKYVETIGGKPAAQAPASAARPKVRNITVE